MKQQLEVISIDSSISVTAQDQIGRQYKVDTDMSLSIGQSILVVNGVVVGLIKTKTEKVFEV